MSRGISVVICSMMGIRVGGQLVYTPAHFNAAGKEINQRVTIPVYANSNKGTNSDGSKGRTDKFELVAWGGLADTCCRSLSPGKALDVVGELHSYNKRLFNQDRSARVDAAGVHIETPRTAITIRQIIFGEESIKFIQNEIAEGKRPVNWNVEGHPEWQTWKDWLNKKKLIKWDCMSNEFFHARVQLPYGQHTINGKVYSAAVQTAAQPVMAQTPLPTAVANAVNIQPAPQPGTTPNFTTQAVQSTIPAGPAVIQPGVPSTPVAPAVVY